MDVIAEDFDIRMFSYIQPTSFHYLVWFLANVIIINFHCWNDQYDLIISSSTLILSLIKIILVEQRQVK